MPIIVSDLCATRQYAHGNGADAEAVHDVVYTLTRQSALIDPQMICLQHAVEHYVLLTCYTVFYVLTLDKTRMTKPPAFSERPPNPL